MQAFFYVRQILFYFIIVFLGFRLNLTTRFLASDKNQSFFSKLIARNEPRQGTVA